MSSPNTLFPTEIFIRKNAWKKKWIKNWIFFLKKYSILFYKEPILQRYLPIGHPRNSIKAILKLKSNLLGNWLALLKSYTIKSKLMEN